MKKDPFRLVEDYPDNPLEAPFSYAVIENDSQHPNCGTDDCCGECENSFKINDLQNQKKAKKSEKNP